MTIMENVNKKKDLLKFVFLTFFIYLCNMELQPLKHYYSAHLKGCLRDGDNKYIKKYTTNGFKKSYQMWNDYNNDSIESFFNDFIREYPEECLGLNCGACLREMQENGSTITYEDLFDILLRRLVIDAYIGFKAEDIVREMLIKSGKVLHDYDVLSKGDEIELDTKYGIDIMTFKDGEVESFFQVKNTSTFSHDGKYIKEKRKEFFDKEREANQYVGGNKYKMMIFYVYDKDAYINDGEFRFYVNPEVNKCGFFLDHLVRRDGSLKKNVKRLNSKKLL